MACRSFGCVCSATLNLGETISVGGQLEWDAAQRELVGRSVVAEKPLDFHANKDVAVSIASQLGIPQMSQRVLREAFGGMWLPVPLDVVCCALCPCNMIGRSSACLPRQFSDFAVRLWFHAQPCVSHSCWTPRMPVGVPKTRRGTLNWLLRCSHRCVPCISMFSVTASNGGHDGGMCAQGGFVKL